MPIAGQDEVHRVRSAREPVQALQWRGLRGASCAEGSCLLGAGADHLD